MGIERKPSGRIRPPWRREFPDRRRARGALAAAGLGGLFLLSCSGEGGRPNILLVTIDTLRADRVGAYVDSAAGASEATISAAAVGARRHASTPTMDRLAREGIVLERALTPVPMTLPSHASILTGLLPPRHGVHNNGSYRLPPGVETLPERLLGAGYRTGAFVSAFVLNRQFGLGQGFEVYDDSLYNERRGDRTVARALRWLGAKDSRPYFLWVHLFEPHTPWAPPAPYSQLPLPEPYDREVAAADAYLGALLDNLPVDPELNHTIVVVLSDHGEGLEDHDELEHGIFLYRETTWIPWIVRLPEAVGAGRRLPELTATPDLAPTLSELVGLAPPAVTDGISLVPILHGRATGLDRRGVYLETVYPKENFGWAPLVAWESQRWKWIRATESELYDLVEDPAETANLVPSVPDTAALMDRRLERAILTLQPLAAGAAGEADAETTERLRSLGYLAAGSDGADDGRELPDPKSMIASHADLEAAKKAMDDRRWSDAIEPFHRVLAVQQRNLVALLGLGPALNLTARFLEAETIYTQAIEISPGNTTAALGLADALYGQEKWDSAIELYALAGRDPTMQGKVQARTAAARFRLGQEGEALDRLRAAAEPAGEPEILRGTYDRLTRYREVRKELSAGGSSNDTRGHESSAAGAVSGGLARRDSLRLEQARLAAALGWVRETEAILNQRFSTAEGEAGRLRLLEMLHTELGRPLQALEVLRRIRELEGDNPPSRLREALLLLSAHRAEEALEVFRSRPRDEIADAGILASWLYNQACAEARLDLREEAMQSLTEAVAAGYDRLGTMVNDPDLQELRTDPRFVELADQLAAQISSDPPATTP